MPEFIPNLLFLAVEEFWPFTIYSIMTIVVTVGILIQIYVQLRSAKDQVKKVEDFRGTLEYYMSLQNEKLKEIAKVGEATYHLSNSAMEEQKRLLAVTSRAKAKITKDPVDIAAAEVAEKLHWEHRDKQLKINIEYGKSVK